MNVVAGEHGDVEARKVAGYAATVVAGLYRIVKGCSLFDTRNDVTDRQAEQLAASVNLYCSALDSSSLDVTFTLGTVFVDSKLVRTNREAYDLAVQLANQMKLRGINEVSLLREVTAGDIERFARHLQKAMHDPQIDAEPLQPTFGGLRARLRSLDGGGDYAADKTPAARASRAFAIAAMCVDALHASALQGKFEPAPRLKRIAARLVQEFEEEPRGEGPVGRPTAQCEGGLIGTSFRAGHNQVGGSHQSPLCSLVLGRSPFRFPRATTTVPRSSPRRPSPPFPRPARRPIRRWL